LVVSGILDEQYAAVRAAYEAQGLVEVDSLLFGEWRSGLFVRAKPATQN
jgi:ribosomal protein L11 methylase PrmA